jgi:hypothetical protein
MTHRIEMNYNAGANTGFVYTGGSVIWAAETREHLGGFGGMPPQKLLKSTSSEMQFLEI